MNWNGLFLLIALSLPVATLSLTVTRHRLFLELRRWAKGANFWLGELLSCPYCLSHWFALAAVAVYRPVFVTSNIHVLDLALSVFTIPLFASFWAWGVYSAIAHIYDSDEEEESDEEPEADSVSEVAADSP